MSRLFQILQLLSVLPWSVMYWCFVCHPTVTAETIANSIHCHSDYNHDETATATSESNTPPSTTIQECSATTTTNDDNNNDSNDLGDSSGSSSSDDSLTDSDNTNTHNDDNNNNDDDDEECRDHLESCPIWAREGKCDENPIEMFRICSKTCNVCFGNKRQHLDKMHGEFGVDQVVQKLQVTKEYLERVKQDLLLHKTTKNSSTKSDDSVVDPSWTRCANSLINSRCAVWAVMGECDANPSYMRSSCAAVCQSCERLYDVGIRCPLEQAGENIWGPGDLNRFFVNMTTSQNNGMNVTILSQPPDGPWIVTIDDFFSSEEANRLIELANELGYKRSMGVGGLKEDGRVLDIVSPSRTSKNTWCREPCASDETTVRVSQRIADLTSIPVDHQESLQLLSYDVGQFYASHHDLIPIHVERQPGVRILTVFLYLNTVEAGGGTRFPLYKNITVEPKLGRALIWPSVLDDDPHTKDPRTEHEALAVVAGHKYAANAWIHQRNYKVPHANDCQ